MPDIKERVATVKRASAKKSTVNALMQEFPVDKNADARTVPMVLVNPMENQVAATVWQRFISTQRVC